MYKVFVFGFFSVCLASNVTDNRNNVCKNFKDYATISSNPNCFYNPDVGAHPSIIVKRYGYPFEKYKVITKDGYIINMYRIPHNNKEIGSRRIPVILQHGIAITSVAWMLNGKKSIAFYLADQGFDVWLPNGRGTEFSTEHVNFTTESPKYWDFSFHEMGIYDIPAIVDYVAENTGQKGNIIYVGHSMGTTMSYVYASLLPDHAKENLKGMISLAPIAYMKNIKSLIKFVIPFTDILGNILESLGLHSVGNVYSLSRALVSSGCIMYPLIIPCEISNAALTGLSFGQVAPESLPVILSHYPTGTGIKTLRHFSQIYNSRGQFRWYNYGRQGNLLRYKREIPPDYPLEKITVPISLFVGRSDFLSSVEKLLETVGVYAISPTPIQKSLIQKSCNRFPLIVTCEVFFSAFSGLSVKQISPEVFPVFLSHYPASTSLKLVLHYGQLMASGDFQYFDNGNDKNKLKYNDAAPPEYPVEKITVPINLFEGNRDFLADKSDVKIFFDQLNSPKNITVIDEFGIYDYAHNDFLIGRHTKMLLGELYKAINNFF